MNTDADAPGRGEEARRASRQRVDTVAPVVNAMTQRALGVTRDISMGGLRLQATEPLVDEALYQVQVELQRRNGTRMLVEAGVQVVRQYRDEAGGVLVGMRFIHLEGANNDRLAAWMDEAGQPR